MNKTIIYWLFIMILIMSITTSFIFNIVQYKSNKKLLRKTKTKAEIIEYLEESVSNCNTIAEEQMEQIKDLQLSLMSYQTAIVKATVYNAVKSQCNSDYLHTASMFELDSINQYQHRIIAVSRDLLKLFPFGTKVSVTGTGIYDGIYTVNDIMNKRYINRIDILINKDMELIPETKNVLIKLYK